MANKEFKDFLDGINGFETKEFDGVLPDGVNSVSATLNEDIMNIYIEFDEFTRTEQEIDIENIDLHKTKRKILQDTCEFFDIEEGECDECEKNEETCYNAIKVESNLYG